MSNSLAYKHTLRALSRWPKDTLRPECQFQDAMRRRLDRKFLPASAPGSQVTAQAAPISAMNERSELEQANVLYSLLENRYSRKYPITGSLMKPASNPTHYEDLIKELEAAPERSWLGTQMNRWKGFLRFQ